MRKNYIGLLRRKETTDKPKKNICESSPARNGWLMSMFAAATLLLGGNSYAQTNIANYTFAKSTGATYTPITGGTKLFPTGTNTTYDNEVSAAITLSSPFTFGGVAINSVYVSANGYITFGVAPSGTTYTPLSTSITNGTGVISAFGQDAGGSTVTGAVPDVSYLDTSTEFIVQYSDHANYFNRTQERLNFQIRLNYATGAIDIVYGSCTDPGTVSSSGTAPQVGIRGNSTTHSTNVNSLMIGNIPAGTTCDWSKSVTGNANSSSMLFSGTTNVNVKIPNGLQYTWTPGTQLPVRTFEATTAVTNNGATLSWTAPAGATLYNVQYRVLGDCDWTNFSGNPVSAATASLTGLTQSTTYQVQVQALNGTAQSIYSHIPNLAGTGNGYVAAGSFTTLANCLSTVTGLASSAITPDTATISWTASTTAPADGYEYYYSTSSVTPLSSATPSGSVAAGVVTANLSGLLPSTQYYYWVRGNCNPTDKGAWSSSANFTTLSLCPTVTAPAANATGVSLTPSITWTAINGATGYKVKVGTTSGGNDIADADIIGGATVNYDITTPLTSSTVYYYSVTAYTATTLTPATPCAVRSFTTVCNAVMAPYTYDVENAANTTSSVIGNCWSSNPSGTTSAFRWDVDGAGSTPSSSTGPSGANSGVKYFYTEASSGATGAVAELYSPFINVTALTNPIVQFYYHMYGSTMGELHVDVYDGAAWINDLLVLTGQQQTAMADPWTLQIVDLSSLTITGNIQVRFRGIRGTDFYGDMSIDDISIIEAPSCLPVNTLAFSNLTSTGADVTWVAPTTPPAMGYDVYHSSTSTAPTVSSTPQYTGVATTMQNIPGTPGSVFYVWVRSNCSVSNQSSWVGPVTYTVPFPAPANDDCSGAIALTPGATFTQNAVTATNIGATTTTDATAVHACQATAHKDVWYSVVVPASGSITIETATTAGTTVTDTVMGVYTGSCGALVSVGCHDDILAGTNNFSRVTLTGQTPGTTLLIAVWNYSATTTGEFLVSAYDASLSTSEISQAKNNITVYPNPFADVLNISDVKNVKSISIVDIAGRVVKTIEKPSSSLQLRELNSGMYMVILNMNDGSRQTIKAIKK